MSDVSQLGGSPSPTVGWWETRWVMGHDGYIVPQMVWVTPQVHFVGGGPFYAGAWTVGVWA